MSERDDKIFSEITSRFEMRGEHLQEYDDVTDLAIQLQEPVTEIEGQLGLPSEQDPADETELLELMRRTTYGELCDPDQIDLGDQLIISGAGFITCYQNGDLTDWGFNQLIPEVRVHGSVADIEILEMPRYSERLGAFFNPSELNSKNARASVVLELGDASLEYLAGSDNPYFLTLNETYAHIYVPLIYTEDGLSVRRRVEDLDH